MKVVSSTPQRLIIEDRPLLNWALLYSMGTAAIFTAITGWIDGTAQTLLVFALGLGALWVAWRLLPFQRFVLDRASGTFTHQIQRLTGHQSWQRPLDDIRRAADEGHWSDGSRLERVTLLTRDGRHALEAGFSGISRAGVIREINDWLGPE